MDKTQAMREARILSYGMTIGAVTAEYGAHRANDCLPQLAALAASLDDIEPGHAATIAELDLALQRRSMAEEGRRNANN